MKTQGQKASDKAAKSTKAVKTAKSGKTQPAPAPKKAPKTPQPVGFLERCVNAIVQRGINVVQFGKFKAQAADGKKGTKISIFHVDQQIAELSVPTDYSDETSPVVIRNLNADLKSRIKKAVKTVYPNVELV